MLTKTERERGKDTFGGTPGKIYSVKKSNKHLKQDREFEGQSGKKYHNKRPKY